MSSSYDEMDVYDNQLKPLIVQIYNICEAHNIPLLLATVPVKASDEANTDLTLAVTQIAPEGRRFLPMQLARLMLKQEGITKIFGLFQMLNKLSNMKGEKLTPEMFTDMIEELMSDVSGDKHEALG